MEIKNKKVKSGNIEGIRFSINDDDKEIARGYLYLMKNDLHDKPFGLMEDIFVLPDYRGKGHGTKIVNEIIKIAKKLRCYKLIATSRYSREKVHKMYLGFKFKDWGKEFRIDF